MRVPEAGAGARAPSGSGYGVAPDDPVETRPVAASFAVPSRERRKAKGPAPGRETAIWDGLVRAPGRPETRLRESLLYPLWGATGVAALVILPPLLWLVSSPAVAGWVTLMTMQGHPLGLIGLLMLTFGSAGLFAVLGYTLLFLGRVLASSALAEVHHPRWPDWELSTIGFGLGRWLWAGLVGGAFGGVPAVAYWVYCGDIDLFDALILTELGALGAVYALMALLVSVLHEDLRAANPLTVVGAIVRVGWGYATPCLAAGAAGLAAVTVGAGAAEAQNAALATFLLWLFWLVALYGAMVTLRVLGLCYAKHARALGWFRGRTGWGV